MNEQEQTLYIKTRIYFHQLSLDNGFELSSIYYKKENDDIVDAKAYIYNEEEMFWFNPLTDEGLISVPEWDYNIDGYDFDDLQKGFDIAYLNMTSHYNFWSVLEQWLPDEISNMDGLQKYLDYCKHNGVTKQFIEYANTLELNTDIMTYHDEVNQGYHIIAESMINDKAIVLGQRESEVSPFVTWTTDPTRSRGFDLGHYFEKQKDAEKDFAKRSENMLSHSLEAKLAFYKKPRNVER